MKEMSYFIIITGNGKEERHVPNIGIIKFEDGLYKEFHPFDSVEIDTVYCDTAYFLFPDNCYCQILFEMSDGPIVRVNVYKEENIA